MVIGKISFAHGFAKCSLGPARSQSWAKTNQNKE
jgi:hypothetical protein